MAKGEQNNKSAAGRWLRVLVWTAVSLLGVAAVAVPAWRRGEPVNALWLVTAGVCAFLVSYRFYSKWLVTKVLVLDELRATPAVVRSDGKDFVPTNKWVVFGHHFAAIAGPGPLVGPVLAAQFGYLPGMLWILVGATLGGGVHDAVVLFSSIRRDGKSLGQMLKEEVNPVVGFTAMVSVLSIITILLAFLSLVVVKALAESPWGLFTIAMTMPLALVMGVGMKLAPRRLGWISLFGVAGLALAVWAGKFLPAWGWDGAFRWSGEGLAWAIICYGWAASVLPVWLLLAPRDYLSSFMKLGTVAVLGVAVVAIAPPLHMPALTKFIDGTGLIAAGPVFPFVCITIACGAVSGFHALVASGTTPKMVPRESVIRSVGYGAMITEMMVGLMALIAACALEPGEYFAINMSAKGTTPEAIVAKVNDAGFPVTVGQMERLAEDLHEPTMFGRAGGAPTFAVGMAKIFARVLGGPEAMSLWYHFAIMFEALFILTTIDAGTRVGRFILQDFLGNLWRPLGDTRSWWANVFTSALLVAAWGYFLLMGVRDPYGGINSLLPLFGIANQMLAVIGFSLGTTVIVKMGRARHAWVTLLPLSWLTAVTFRAAWLKVFSPDPRLGFLSAARMYGEKVAAGGEAAQLAEWRALAFNNQLNAFMAGLFVVLVTVILAGCVREWWRLLRGRKELVLREAAYVRLEG